MIDDDEPRYRSTARRAAREAPISDEQIRQSALADAIDFGVRRIVTGLVIAGGLIGLGVYAGGDEGAEAPRYQVTTASDGRVIRLNTESGTVIVCRDERCAIMLQRGQDLDDEIAEEVRDAVQRALPEQQARPALPAPAETPDNAAAAPEATR